MVLVVCVCFVFGRVHVTAVFKGRGDVGGLVYVSNLWAGSSPSLSSTSYGIFSSNLGSALMLSCSEACLS